ncbi:MAG: hypothetical protein QM778_23100 [Myxococcales bacterium]
MNQSSLSPELSVGPEPDRPRSAFVSAIVLLGVCSALAVTAPALIRSLEALLESRAPGSTLPSLLEVSLGILGVVALSSVVFGVITDLRSRLGGSRYGRRWRRHRRPWEQYLMECDALDAQHALQEYSRVQQKQQTFVSQVKNPRSMATLRLVEATPWPLGGSSAQPRHQGRVQPVTQLGFPAASRPTTTAAPRRTRNWRAQEPVYYTPYPFSVWSFHDNIPDDYDPALNRPNRTWLWATLLFAGAALAAVFWWRAYGISVPFSV